MSNRKTFKPVKPDKDTRNPLPVLTAASTLEIVTIYAQTQSIQRSAVHFGLTYYKMRLMIQAAKKASGKNVDSVVKSVDDRLECLEDGTAFAYYKQGYTDSQIARAIGGRVTPNRVQTWRAQNGYPINVEIAGTRALVSRKLFAVENDGCETATELNIVNLLYNHPGGLTAKEITNTLELARNYVYIVIRKLVKRELVVKIFHTHYHHMHAPVRTPRT